MSQRGRHRLRPRVGDVADPEGFHRLLTLYVEALAVKGYSEATCNTRLLHLEGFVRWAAERSLTRPAEITRPILERYQRWLYYYRKANGEPLSFHTQSCQIVSLRSFFRWLARQNRILYNPASELEAPRYNKRLPRFVLTPEEVEQVLALADLESPFGLRDRALLETLYATGMRRSEAVALTLGALDAARRTVLIREGKGGKDRIVPIGLRALHWLDRYLKEVRPQIVTEPDEGFLFLTYLGQPFCPGALSGLVRRYVERARLGKAGSCHLLRHSMATAMLENGADIRFIQEILGHVELTTTERYTHVSIRKLQEVYAATHPAAELAPHAAEAPPVPLDSPERPSPAPAPTEPEAPARARYALLDALDAEAGDEPEEDAEPEA